MKKWTIFHYQNQNSIALLLCNHGIGLLVVGWDYTICSILSDLSGVSESSYKESKGETDTNISCRHHCCIDQSYHVHIICTVLIILPQQEHWIYCCIYQQRCIMIINHLVVNRSPSWTLGKEVSIPLIVIEWYRQLHHCKSLQMTGWHSIHIIIERYRHLRWSTSLQYPCHMTRKIQCHLHHLMQQHTLLHSY